MTKDLVLIGGGHAHVHVLKGFGMRPVRGVRVTLIARDVEAPYSGMLPGYIAGHYTFDECHIDLNRLARFAGVRLIHDEAVGLDRAARLVLCRSRPPVRYDLLSIDIGSTPRAGDVPGAAENATPVKPIVRFAERWDRIVGRVRQAEHPLRIAVVGGGAGGVELALAVEHRLRTLLAEEGRSGLAPSVVLVTRGELLPHHIRRARHLLKRALATRGIAVETNAEIVRVEPGALIAADGRRVGFDEALWVTQAGAAPWLRETGLALDDGGFIQVDAALRSLNDPLVFAAGDVASVVPYPREKAGVYAVRQGPPLTANLRRVLAGEAPRPFRPQKHNLALIGTGDGKAVASRGPFAAEGAWLWRLKEWIDRRWMRQYQELPAMERSREAATAADAAIAEAMRCGGCGAKVPAPILGRVLRRLAPLQAEHAVAALDPPDDAAVLRAPTPGLLTVQSVDFFRAFVTDPYLFGRIAANHALGDIYAMGGEPSTVLAIACLPPASEAVVENDLFHMLRGALDTIEAAGARLVGGHSAEAAEAALGFAVTGTVAEAGLLRKSGLRPGDRLILTKPIGTGTILAADMRAEAKARWVEAAIATMLHQAGPAAACLREHGAVACTDVTGFGLIGHLLEMLRAAGDVSAALDMEAIPVLPGVRETLRRGIVSTLHPSNIDVATDALNGGPIGDIELKLLADPQTAGGLLAGVPAERAALCIVALRALGYREAAEIGTVEARSGDGGGPHVRILQTPSATV
ncbi:MAG TPA: selenide, water dikinase SelD [Stellaceae bacterium]